MKESHKKDVVSDPARDDQIGSDWASEGGSTPTGPATHTLSENDKNDEGSAKDAGGED